MKQMKIRNKFNVIDPILYFLCFYAVHMTCKRGTANAFVLPARKTVKSFDTSRMLFNKKDLDRGFNILENASKIVPQGQVVSTAKGSLNFIWKVNIFMFVIRNTWFLFSFSSRGKLHFIFDLLFLAHDGGTSTSR